MVNRFPQTFGSDQVTTSNFVPREEEEVKKPKTPRSFEKDSDPSSRFEDANTNKQIVETNDETFLSARHHIEDESQQLDTSIGGGGGLDLSLNKTQYFDAIGAHN